MSDLGIDIHSGVTAPVSCERDELDLPVTGAIPMELSGTLFRNGPNPLSGHFRGNDMLSWWGGSAMLHSLKIEDGRALRYANRWARTNAWAEHTGRPTQEGAGWGENPNVHVISHAGRVLALSEGGIPFSVNGSNEPTEPFTYGGALPGGMTAHPKQDPATGELFYFKPSWQSPFLMYGALDQDGRSTVRQSIALDAPAMMHDFAITATRALVLDLSVGLDMTLLGRGAPMPVGWSDSRPSRIGVMPRAGGEVSWLEVAPCFVLHVINAYDRDSETVVLDVVRYPRFLDFDDGERAFAPNPLGTAWRFTLDLGQGTVGEQALDDRHSELPRVDDSRTGRRHRYVYAVEQPTTTEMRGLVKLDLDTGVAERHAVAPGDQNSEPIFVGRQPTGRSEDDGWVLVCVYRRATDTTDVVILNADDFEGDPIATIHLPVRIPAGFHGSWVPAAAAS